MDGIKLLWLLTMVVILSGCNDKPANEELSSDNVMDAQSELVANFESVDNANNSKSTALFSARATGSGKLDIVNFETITDCVVPNNDSKSLSVVATNSRSNPDAFMNISGTSESAQIEISLGEGKVLAGEGAVYMHSDDGTIVFRLPLKPTPNSTATNPRQVTATFICE